MRGGIDAGLDVSVMITLAYPPYLWPIRKTSELVCVCVFSRLVLAPVRASFFKPDELGTLPGLWTCSDLASLAPLMKQEVETDSGNCGFTWIVLSSMRFVSSATLCAVRAP